MSKKVAIIVEWDNARLSDVERAREMLRRLATQTREVTDRDATVFDLLLIYNPDDIPAEVPNTVVDECVDRNNWPGTVRVLSGPHLSYYNQKNFGVTQTDGEIIVFIDSDVVPDDGWLSQLLAALERPDVDIVGGETYLVTETYYDRLCAAFWNFDVRRPGRGLYETKNFYANNVALKRSVVSRFPFKDAETYRGQCAMLAKELRANGVRLWRVGSAMVSHPPPEGFKHFVNRAVCQGHDALLLDKNIKKAVIGGSPVGSTFRFLRSIAKAPARIWQRHKQANLSLGGMLTAFALSISYSSLMYFGELAAFVSPQFVRRHFSI